MGGRRRRSATNHPATARYHHPRRRACSRLRSHRRVLHRDRDRSRPTFAPQKRLYAKRQRYRAEKLLDYLVASAVPTARLVLGLTAVDISTTKGNYEDWGILGLATLDGRSAVLSSFRCHRGAKNAAHVRTRYAKTAVHELGHSFGLDHCTTAGCIMHDGEGSVLTTDTERDLCADTRARLTAAGVLRPDAVSPF